MRKTIYYSFTLFCFLSSCIYIPLKDKDIIAVSDQIGNTEFDKVHLNNKKESRAIYTSIDSLNKPLLVFIHGAPGNVLNFRKFHADTLLNKKFNILSYDRPGYGKRKGGRAVKSLEKQSEILHQIIKSYDADSVVLFAHSFGGPIALDYASRYSNVKGIFLAAVAVDPEKEKYFWFSPIGKWWLTKWMLPRFLKTTGTEKYSHEEELKKLEPKLNAVKTKVLAMHGTSDSIVPVENLYYLQNKLVNAGLETKKLTNVDHFFPLGLFNMVRDKLLNF